MLHDDLLEQSRMLVNVDARRPRQVNLRRAVSAAYYAVFHALAFHVSRTLLPAGREYRVARATLRRALEHNEMHKALAGFSAGNPATIYQAMHKPEVDQRLRMTAKVFRELQRQQHVADYDVEFRFKRDDVNAALRDAADALSNLDSLFSKRSQLGTTVALALSFHTKLRKRGV